MSARNLPRVLAICAIVLGFLAIRVPAVAATKEKILYSFCSENNCADGKTPLAGGLIFDDTGNLYGTALGGANSAGVVFKLTPNGNGTWTETVLYNFCSLPNCTDGSGPAWSGLAFDAMGNLYGTTGGGGANTCGNQGCGAVFELSPVGDGTWTEIVLHNFSEGGDDGWSPVGGVVFDSAGNLYGTTQFGGHGHGYNCGACGIAFELVPNKGSWSETVLHNFCSAKGCADGAEPSGTLAINGSGRLYGTTPLGGSHNCGSQGCGLVFQLARGKNGKWKENVLHTFAGGRKGANPHVSLILDAAGNLYGTAGMVFELKKNRDWAETVLYQSGLASSLLLDKAGNLFTAVSQGGTDHVGSVIELKSGKNGKRTAKTVYSFSDAGSDGTYPESGLIFDKAGSLYGTTQRGGNSGVMCDGFSGCGTVFKITP